MRSLIAASLLLASSSLRAQSTATVLHGRVVSRRGDAPLVAATLRAVPVSDTTAVTEGSTDGSSRFELRVVNAAEWIVTVHRIGFAPAQLRVDSAHATRDITIRLEPITRLEAMQIASLSAATVQLARRGFFERQRETAGSFVDSLTIARKKPTSLVSFLRPYLKGCTMIFIDGEPGPLQDVEPSEVMAIEIYRSNLQAPPRFHNPLERGPVRCGSIVVWRIV
jgi:hypothetical protein